MVLATFKAISDDTEFTVFCERVTMTNCTYHIIDKGKVIKDIKGYALIDIQSAYLDIDCAFNLTGGAL